MKGKITVGLAIIMALALLMSFEFVAAPVGKMIGVASNRVANISKTVFIGALGLFLISSGVAALAVPVVGIILIAIGVVLVGYAVWPFFSKRGE
jgi:hypothetical protein